MFFTFATWKFFWPNAQIMEKSAEDTWKILYKTCFFYFHKWISFFYVIIENSKMCWHSFCNTTAFSEDDDHEKVKYFAGP